MTVTDVTSLLHPFRTKIEEAVALVPGMGAEEKLKAVQFWNFISEKLQEIVNNSAADINALALKMEENAEKMSLSIQEPITNLHVGDNVCNSQFLVAANNYSMCPDSSHQYTNNEELGNEHVVSYLPDETHLASATVPGTTLAKDLVSLSHSSVLEPALAVSNVCSTKLQDTEPPNVFSLTSAPKDDCTQLISSSTSANDSVESLNCSEFVSSESTSSSSSSCVQVQKDPIESSYQCPTTTSNNSNNNNNKLWTSRKKGKLLLKTYKKMQQRINLTKPTASQKQAFLQQNCSLSQKNKSVREENCDNDRENKDSDEQNSDNGDTTYLTSDKSFIDSDEEIEHLEADVKDDSLSETKSSSKVLTDQNNVEKKEKNMGVTEILVIQTANKKFSKNKKKSGSLHICEWCNKQLPSTSALTSHRWIHTKPYSCTECSAHFSTKGNLIVHQRRHTGEKPFVCEQCNSRFSTNGNLKRHLKTHSGEKPWHCTLCSGRFTEKKSLKVHMRRHTGERPYQCQVCGKKFAQNGILQTHMAMHLNQKAHLCEHCGKSFRQKSQLRLHMLRHEGIRKFICAYCPARFLTKGDLDRHNRVHTGERPFVCDLCAKTFTRQQSLNEHTNRHYGMKPYECKYCGKAFAEMSACYKHIKQHERSQPTDEDVLKSSDCDTNYTTVSQDLSSVISTEQTPLANLPIPPGSSVDQVIKVHHSSFSNVDTPKYAVLVHTTDAPLEVGSEMTVMHQNQTEATVPNSQENQVTVAVANHISDFTAINLLASASTHQQNF